MSTLQTQAQAHPNHHQHTHHHQVAAVQPTANSTSNTAMLRARNSLQQLQFHQQQHQLNQGGGGGGLPSNSMSTSFMPIRTAGNANANALGSSNAEYSPNPNTGLKSNPFAVGSGGFGNGTSVGFGAIGSPPIGSGNMRAAPGSSTSASPAMASFGTPPLRGTPTLGGGGVIGVGSIGSNRASPAVGGNASTSTGLGLARNATGGASSPGVLSGVPGGLSISSASNINSNSNTANNNNNNNTISGIITTTNGGKSGSGTGIGIVNQSSTNFAPGSGSNNTTSLTTTATATTATTSSRGSGGSGITEPAIEDQVHASVSHLLTRAYSLPCSTAAQAFTQLVQPTARFQLALDALLPLLDPIQVVELAHRILVSFILYSLYAPHPIAINPFRNVLYVAYAKEREKAIRATDEGATSPNEQLVWVLWKILKGDGNDIGPYSPSTLARSPLPAKLRAVNLVLDDEMYYSTTDLDDITYSYFQKQQNNQGHPAPSGFNPNGLAGTSITSPTATGSSGLGGSPLPRSPIGTEEERRNERAVQGMRLLLLARERILSLAEQRVLFPLINDVTSSRLITSLDITPLVARNPQIAHPLFVGLLTNSSNASPTSHGGTNARHISQFLDVLPFLSPMLPSMDLMGRLLRDQTPISVTFSGGGVEGRYETVGELVRMEVLGRFIHECINWIERAEREEREGLISDDRVLKGVQNLCRFFNSLIKLQIVDPSSDADAAEMMHFTLRYAKFEDANVLYRLLALSRY